MYRIFIVSLLFTVSINAEVSNQYLCVPNQAVGFSYNKQKNEWESINFKPEVKMIISKNKTEYLVRESGHKTPFLECKTSEKTSSHIQCNNASGDRNLSLNIENGRYIFTNSFDYVNDVEKFVKMPGEKENIPAFTSMIIGLCTPF